MSFLFSGPHDGSSYMVRWLTGLDDTIHSSMWPTLHSPHSLAQNRDETKEIRPIPMPVPCIFQERIPLYQMQPIKHERVPGIIQHEEARGKVIRVNIIRAGRSGRHCDHRIGMGWDIIHNMPHFIHLAPIFGMIRVVERYLFTTKHW